MAERVYCTYFDHNYLTRGLALYRSLQRHAPGSRLWVLCLSESCYQALRALKLANLIPRRLDDFETANPAVEATRARRRVGDLSRQRPVLLRLARADLRRNARRIVWDHSSSFL